MIFTTASKNKICLFIYTVSESRSVVFVTVTLSASVVVAVVLAVELLLLPPPRVSATSNKINTAAAAIQIHGEEYQVSEVPEVVTLVDVELEELLLLS